ncbi:MAG: cupredoxin domain-containing protein, partial [Candidatus Woesearchaeota archaeon]
EVKTGAPEKKPVRFEIEASQWAFNPNTITVKKGDHVIITLTSKDVDHGFGISAYEIKEKIPAGRAVDVEFDADKAGEFPFYCTVYCGTGHSSMKGKLVVTE